MLDKVEETIERYRMFNVGDKVIVAVSGGPDSLALLYVLHQLQKNWDLAFLVAHFNHMLREEAAREADYVAAVAEGLGVPAVIGQGDVGQKAKEAGLSIQMAARKLRYDFLADLAHSTGSHKIALAHHRDDAAETVVMNFLRGPSPRGLAGIPPVRGKIVRPLLAVTRREIEYYIKEHDLQPLRDPSNEKKIYLRNRVRLELMPILKGYNPNLVNRLTAGAELFREEDRYLDKIAMGELARLGADNREGDRLSFNLRQYQALPLALKRRVLRLGFLSLVPEGQDLSFAQVERVVSWLANPPVGKALAWPRGVKIRLQGDRVVLGRYQRPPTAAAFQITLAEEGQVDCPDGLLQVTWLPPEMLTADRIKACAPGEALVDGERVTFPLTVRNRRPGDRFRPLGAGGSKKVKDFLIDLKIPAAMRSRIPLVVTAAGEIVWIAGWRLDERFKVTPATTKVLRFSYIHQSGDEII